MTQESEFERLEEFVRKLLGRFDLLRDEKRRLEGVLLEKENRIIALEAKLASADNERGDISSRVKGLLDQIENWEKDLDQDFSVKKAENAESENDITEDDIEVIHKEPEKQEERDRNLQQNLFNVGPRVSDIGD